MDTKILAITQARMSSSRLPGKVLMEVVGKTLLELHIERVHNSNLIYKHIIGISTNTNDDVLENFCVSKQIEYFRGSEDDVLDRFYQIALKFKPNVIVRLTADCPLIDAEIIDNCIQLFLNKQVDYASNTLKPTFPDGMDVEVFKFSALEKAWKEALLPSEREHVTPYIWKNSTFFNQLVFTSQNFIGKEDFSSYRLTVDQQEDFELVKKLIEIVGCDKPWIDYITYLKNNPKLFLANSSIKRNEGFMKSMEKDTIKLRYISNFKESNKYRKIIHDLIPGGAHTYSKGDDQFPQLTPAAISHGKGAYVWDIDGNKFLDCSMGLTSVGLGHAYEPVLEKVKQELDKGVNFQRPSVIEKEIAEKFLSLIPQHDMVKFAKNGSIVTTAAVKLARAKTGRKLVAFPGDHPFYSYDDWFIGKTECSLGVPEDIKNLSLTFKSCDLNSLKELFEKYPDQIACVITEPERSALGNNQFGEYAKEFLENAIELTHLHGALFIVDEMVTGFKTALPGSITKFNLQPDMATWGKGIANGFSFCALTGKKEIMELGGIRNTGAEKVFLISTTHGGETHSLAAGIASINEFESKDVIKHNHSIGDYFLKKCTEVISKNNLTEYIELIPCNWMPVFMFKDKHKSISTGYRTLALQEMIKRGVLFQGAFIPCYSHTNEDVDYFAQALNESLEVYKNALEHGFEKYLIGLPTKPVFRKNL